MSGVFALNFFELGWSNVPVLDLFVEAGGRTDEIVTYIKDHEGYDKEDYPEITMGVAGFLFSGSKRPGKTIRLTATGGPPVETILRCSYATTSVNFITWNKAYSVFPVQTLIHHTFYALRLWNDEFGALLREQVNQGWTNRDIVWPDLTTDARHRIKNGHRRVGDKSSLVTSLDTNYVQKVSTPDSAIEFAQFEVFAEPEFPVFGRERHDSPQIRVDVLTSPALRHDYTFASTSWSKFVSERLQRWVLLEVLKLKLEERPEQFANGIPYHSNISLPSDFHPPEIWDYADNMIPKWYREWEDKPPEEQSSFGNLTRRRRR